MPTHVDQRRATDAIVAEFVSIDKLIAGLDRDDWHKPTALTGWDVQANVAHIIGTEAMLLGEPAPAVDVDVASLTHVRNDVGSFNEAWVVALAGVSPEEMVDGFRRRAAARTEALGGVTPEQWAAEGFTPAGQDSHGRFMRIRAMDIWMHEQDIRDAVGRPGHESGPVVELVLDELVTALGYVVGKKAGAPDGSSVTFELTGDSGRSVHILVDGRAKAVDSLPGPATTTLRLPVGRFVRLAGGRSTDIHDVQVDGDAALGQQILADLAFTI